MGASEFPPEVEALIERARALGARQGTEHALATDASEIQLMGSYERAHFGLGDFDDDLASDIADCTAEQINEDVDTLGENYRRATAAAWDAFVSANNAAILAIHPHARET